MCYQRWTVLPTHTQYQGLRARPTHRAPAPVLRCSLRVQSDPRGIPHRPYEQPRLHRLCSSLLLRKRGRYVLAGTNNRDCIDSALPCCQENVADTCSQGKNGGLPWEEFTIAKAAKKSKLGKYSTVQLGKWVTSPVLHESPMVVVGWSVCEDGVSRPRSDCRVAVRRST